MRPYSMESYRHCSICSQLADYQSAFQKIGREEQDTHLPAAAGGLQLLRDLAPDVMATCK